MVADPGGGTAGASTVAIGAPGLALAGPRSAEMGGDQELAEISSISHHVCKGSAVSIPGPAIGTQLDDLGIQERPAGERERQSGHVALVGAPAIHLRRVDIGDPDRDAGWRDDGVAV